MYATVRLYEQPSRAKGTTQPRRSLYNVEALVWSHV